MGRRFATEFLQSGGGKPPCTVGPAAPGRAAAVAAVGVVFATLLVAAGCGSRKRSADLDPSAMVPRTVDAAMVVTRRRAGPRARARPKPRIKRGTARITPQNLARVRLLGVLGGLRPYQLALSPDGRWLAASSHQQLVVYDRRSGTRIGELNAPDRFIGTPAFSPDGRHLLVPTDRAALIVRPSGLRVVRRIEVRGAAHTAAVFARDGRSVFLPAAPNRVVRYSLKDGAPIATYVIPGAVRRAVVGDLALSPDGQMLAAKSNSRIVAWRLSDGKMAHRWWLGDATFRGLAGAPGRWVAVVSEAGQCRLRRLVNGTDVGRTACSDGENRVAVSRDGRVVVAASKTGTKVIDPATGKVQRVLAGEAAWRVGVSADGAWIATGTDRKVEVWRRHGDGRHAVMKSVGAETHAGSGTLLVHGTAGIVVARSGRGLLAMWDLRTGKVRRTVPHDYGPVRQLAVAPDGKQVMALVERPPHARVVVWRPFAIRAYPPTVIEAGTATRFAVSPSGSALVTAHRGARGKGTVRKWSLAPGMPPRGTVLVQTPGRIRDLTYTPDGRHLVVAAGLADVAAYTAASPSRRVRRFEKNGSQVLTVAVSRDGKRVAAGDEWGVTIWRFADGVRERQLTLPDDKTVTASEGGRTLAFSPDGRHLLVDGSNTRYYRFDTTTWRRQGTPLGSGGVNWAESLSWSPDGQLFGVADSFRVRIVPLRGQGGRDFKGHRVAFSPDQRFFVTGTQEGLLRIWGIP